MTQPEPIQSRRRLSKNFNMDSDHACTRGIREGAVLNAQNASAFHALTQLFASQLVRVHKPATNALEAHSNGLWFCDSFARNIPATRRCTSMVIGNDKIKSCAARHKRVGHVMYTEHRNMTSTFCCVRTSRD